MLGLCFCAWAFSSCGEQGLLFVVVCELLIAVGARALGARASVVVAYGYSSCGAWAQLLRGMWDLPGPRLEPVSPALAGGFLFIYLFIYLLAALGLCCCALAFSSCSECGLLFVVVCRLLIAVVYLVEHGL